MISAIGKYNLKQKNEITERNRNYKKVDNKISRIFKYKETAALRDFLYKVWFVQFGFWEFVFSDN